MKRDLPISVTYGWIPNLRFSVIVPIIESALDRKVALDGSAADVSNTGIIFSANFPMFSPLLSTERRSASDIFNFTSKSKVGD